MSTPLKPHAGTQVFLLPDLGEGLTEAGLVQWLVSVGDTITTDQPIAEVETAKSIVELPSPFAGIVTALHGTAGDTIDVGAPVLEVADSLPSPAAPTAEPAQPEHEAYREEERAGSGNVLIGYGTTARPTMGRRRPSAASVSAPRSPATASTPTPTAVPSAPSTPETPPPSRSADRRPVAVRSPLVRRLARDLGLDVHSIAATGTDGAVTRADVLRAAVENAVDTAVDAAVDSAAAHHDGSTAGVGTPGHPLAETVDGLGVLSRERMSPLRRAVSAKLTRSRSEIPEATVWVDVDATTLWDLRSQMAPEEARLRR